MTQTTEANMADIVELQTADQVFEILSRWHNHQIQTLKHMQDIPEGSTAGACSFCAGVRDFAAAAGQAERGYGRAHRR